MIWFFLLGHVPEGGGHDDFVFFHIFFYEMKDLMKGGLMRQTFEKTLVGLVCLNPLVDQINNRFDERLFIDSETFRLVQCHIFADPYFALEIFVDDDHLGSYRKGPVSRVKPFETHHCFLQQKGRSEQR